MEPDCVFTMRLATQSKCCRAFFSQLVVINTVKSKAMEKLFYGTKFIYILFFFFLLLLLKKIYIKNIYKIYKKVRICCFIRVTFSKFLKQVVEHILLKLCNIFFYISDTLLHKKNGKSLEKCWIVILPLDIYFLKHSSLIFFLFQRLETIK